MITLQSKFISVHLDPNSGYAITHLSETGKPNVIDTADKGRLIQQSFYGGANGSTWRGHDWVTNPVQGGSALNVPSKVLTAKQINSTTHLSTIQPIDWATGRLLDSFFIQRVEIKGRIVQVDYSMSFSDEPGPVRDQEVPAVFVKKNYNTLVTADASYIPTWNTNPPYGQYYPIPNGFAALVNKRGYGLGLRSSVASRLTTYSYPGQNPCSYVAPLVSFALVKDLRFHHSVVFTVGLLSSMRKLLEV